ncbi:MAG: hypothetical protein NT011_09185 [Kiritimatiellaeota bacterium]|nr:hypothetical protein [Kiritimatiellota bacterium]
MRERTSIRGNDRQLLIDQAAIERLAQALGAYGRLSANPETA